MIAEIVDIDTGVGYSAVTIVRRGALIVTHSETPSFQVRS